MAKKSPRSANLRAVGQLNTPVVLTPEMEAAIRQILTMGPQYLVGFLEALSTRLNAGSGIADQFVAELEGFLPATGHPDRDGLEQSPGSFPVPGVCFQVTVKLKGTKPPITRKLEVPDMPFGELHEVLQIAMGWTNSHMHDFTVGKDVRIGPKLEGNTDFGMNMVDEEGVWISEVPASVRNKILYTYDFGDDWTHEVKLSEAQPMQPGISYPRCLAGSRNCPPEDCGGIWGYEHLCELLVTPEAERTADDRERLEWLGEYDPAEFPLELVNAELTKLFAPPPPKVQSPAKKRTKKSAK